MLPHSLLLLLLVLLCSFTPLHGSAQALPSNNVSTKYLEVTHTLPTDYQIPTCSQLVFQLDGNGYPSVAGKYFSAGADRSDPWAVSGSYSPPANCSGPWSAIVAELSASSSGKQVKQIAAVWFGGVEILRSSTVETAAGQGAFWKVKKDVTRYASVLSQTNATASLVVEDVAKDAVSGNHRASAAGDFHINVSLSFYGGKIGENGLVETEENLKSGDDHLLKLPSESGGSVGKVDNSNVVLKNKHFYLTPADLVIPVSSDGVNTSGAFWFLINNGSDLQSKEIQIPTNAYKAVLEIYVSSHASDEYWYSNPPTKLSHQKNNLSTASPVIKSAFREVFAQIDGLYVGSFVPFPIVYSGGIDPSFWDPLVPVGAFDLPAYDLDLTPFLGLLLDNKPHTFTFGITDATSFWLVDANLHLWLDHSSSLVTAGLVKYRAPEVEFSRVNKFGTSESKFKITAEREFKFVGWVSSSSGNLTTKINYELDFRNTIKIKGGGRFKKVMQNVKTETEIEVETRSELLISKSSYVTEYPLELKIETENKGGNGNADSTKTKFYHEKEEKSSMKVLRPNSEVVFYTSLSNRQESEGRKVVQGQAVLSSVASTEQKYKYRDGEVCYIRNVVGGAGLLLEDSLSDSCLEMEDM